MDVFTDTFVNFKQTLIKRGHKCSLPINNSNTLYSIFWLGEILCIHSWCANHVFHATFSIFVKHIQQSTRILNEWMSIVIWLGRECLWRFFYHYMLPIIHYSVLFHDRLTVRVLLFSQLRLSHFLAAEWQFNSSRVTHICVSNLTLICSDNGLSPGRRPAIIWTSAPILLFPQEQTSVKYLSKLIYIH